MKVIAKQLAALLYNNEMLDKFQSDFHKTHSTETVLLKMYNDIKIAAVSGRYSVLVLLDLAAAFDTVDRKLLLQRPSIDFGISGMVIGHWLASHLTDRTFSVCLNNKVCAGRGGSIGTILFLLYQSFWKYHNPF